MQNKKPMQGKLTPTSAKFKIHLQQQARKKRKTSIPAAIQRYFTQLDPVANAYYELATPITLTGDFDIGIKLLTTDDTNQVILGDIHTDNLYMNMDSGNISLWINGQYRTFNAVSKNLTDGKQHDILFQLRTNTLECIIDRESLGTLNVTNPVITSANLRIGTSNSVLIYFDGILSDLIITDKSGAEDVITTFPLDKPPASALYEYGPELVDSLTGAGNGVLSEDTFTSDGTTSWFYVYDDIVTEVGETYHLSAEFYSSQAEAKFKVWDSLGGYTIITSTAEMPNGVNTLTFVATSSSTRVSVHNYGTAMDDETLQVVSLSTRKLTNYSEANASKSNILSSESSLGDDLWSGGDIDTQTQPSGYYSSFVDGVITSDGTSWGCYSNLDFPVVEGKTYLVKVRNEATNAQGKNKITSKSGGSTFLGTIEPPIHDGYSEALFTVPEGHTGQIYMRVYCQIGAVLGATVRMTEVSVRELQGNALTRILVADEDIELFTKTDDGWLGDKELVTNGGFYTDSGWDKVQPSGTISEIIGGRGHVVTDGQASGITQVITSGIGVKITFDYEHISGQLKIQFGTQILDLTSSGSYSLISTAVQNTNGKIYLYRAAAGEGYFDNISAKRLIPIATQV